MEDNKKRPPQNNNSNKPNSYEPNTYNNSSFLTFKSRDTVHVSFS